MPIGASIFEILIIHNYYYTSHTCYKCLKQPKSFSRLIWQNKESLHIHRLSLCTTVIS